MQMLRTTGGRLVTEESIKDVDEYPRKHSGDSVERHEVRLRDGSTVYVNPDVFSRFEADGRPVVAGTGDCQLLVFVLHEDGSGDVERIPIVAWRISSFGAEPVTPLNEGLEYSAHRRHGVELPSGRVIVGWLDTVYPDAKAFAEGMRQEMSRN